MRGCWSGSVERCGTSVSSGSEELDRKTCEILFATAQFRLAQDAHGKPVEALFYQTVTWELEEQDTPSLVASSEELESLEKSVPKPKKHAKLVNSTDVARSMDYPLEALKKGEEGRATAWLLVGTDGRVEKCGIHSSSGSNSLDEQTCNLLIANAIFQPAFDRRGRPVQSISYQPIVWKLQEGEWEPGDWATRMSYVIGPDMAIRSCAPQVMAGNSWTEGPEQWCKLFLTLGRGALAFARDRTKLHDALVVIESWILTTPERVMPEVGRGPGEVLIVVRSGSASYDPTGKRVSCTSRQSFGFEGYIDDLCQQDAPNGLPVELPKPPGRAITTRVLSAIYLKGEPD